MKELSIEEKAQRYDKALKKARLVLQERGDEPDCASMLANLFPELAESEDEKIRKELINFCKIAATGQSSILIEDANQFNRWAAWLEKQGEQKPAECRQETKPNGGIVSEDFNDGDGYYKVNLAYLSKSQVELIENLVASWQNSANNIAYWSEEDEELCEYLIESIDASDPLPTSIYSNCKRWLKALKERYTWKPSEEQIRAVEEALSLAKNCGEDYSFDLRKLLEQLKAL